MNPIDDLLIRATEALCDDRLSEAISLAEEAIELTPFRDEAWGLLGDAQTRQGRFEDALSSYERAGALAPGCRRAPLSQARVLERLGRLREAEEAWREACAREPDFPDTHLALGRLLYRLGEGEQALVALERALELAPAEVAAHCLRGDILVRQGQFPAAEAAYRGALRVARRYGPAQRGLSLALGAQGRIEEANAARPEGPVDPGELREVVLDPPGLEPVRARFRCRPGADAADAEELEGIASTLAAVAGGFLGQELRLSLGVAPILARPNPAGEGWLLFEPDYGEDASPFDDLVPEVTVAVTSGRAIARLHARIGAPPCFNDLLLRARVDLQCLFSEELRVERVGAVDRLDSGVRIGPSTPGFAQAVRRASAPPLSVLVVTEPRLLQVLALPVGWSAIVRGAEVVSVRDARGRERLDRKRRSA